jgi:hypothetical protein
MRNASVVTTYKILMSAGAAWAVMSAVGCGATESTCSELQRTCGCDNLKPCPGDGSAGTAGATGGGNSGAGGADVGPDVSTDADGSVADVGSAGKGGAGGASGSGGAGGASGSGGAAGKAGTAGAGGTREDAAAEASVRDGEIDVTVDAVDETADVTTDGGAEGGEVDATEEGDAVADVALDGDAADIGPTCDVTKSPSTEPCLIDELYGIFVSPTGNDTTGAGTRAAPFATIGKGVQVAAQRSLRVYACDNGSGYAEQLDLPDGTRLHGGFSCTTWNYLEPQRSAVHAPASPGLAIRAAVSAVLVEDIDIDTPDAAASATSLAVLIDASSNVTLRRMKIVAGKGGIGLNGVIGAQGSDGADVTASLVGSDAICPSPDDGHLGGSWSAASTCGSKGGAGGTAYKGSDGTAGVGGTPRTNVSPPNVDNGGAKGVAGADGGAGSPGDAGAAGVATTTTGVFTNTGYSPAAAAVAATGSDGNAGQGGARGERAAALRSLF